MGIYLSRIKGPNDIKKIPKDKLPELAKEIRQFLIKNVSETGGHLASNLGAVELTMALHLCFNLPEDKIIWDVGHQSYVHKMLTGRLNEMNTLRKYGGLSGFPKEEESPCDSYDAGHSSTSLSVAAGYAAGRDLKNEKYHIAAVIGDGSMSGGMVYEAMNNLARIKSNVIIILNDNEMSISRNVGGIATYLGHIRTDSKYIDFKGDIENVLGKTEFGSKVASKLKKTKDSIRDLIIPGELFRNMGLGYFGPVDGHSIEDLNRAMEAAMSYRGAVVVHVVTKKGKGYAFAEKNPSKFHGISAFDMKTGEIKAKTGESYTKVFGDTICRLAEKDSSIVAITAAMADGTGLGEFRHRFPEKFFDVGIAEEHAVTFASGLASSGMKPVVCIYSTFLQRSYDQIIHDVCMTGKHVVFVVDRAGLVGDDGKTHQGIYDIAFLSTIPGIKVISPKDKQELVKSLEYALNCEGPIVVRYPKGPVYESGLECTEILDGKSELVAEGKDLAIIAVGGVFEAACNAAYMLESDGISVTLVNARFTSPIDSEMFSKMAKWHKLTVVIEEGIESGGYGEHVSAFLYKNGYRGKFENICLPDDYIEHGTQGELRKKYGLDAESVYKRVFERYASIRKDS